MKGQRASSVCPGSWDCSCVKLLFSAFSSWVHQAGARPPSPAHSSCSWETVGHCAHVSLELTILLPQPLECQHGRCTDWNLTILFSFFSAFLYVWVCVCVALSYSYSYLAVCSLFVYCSLVLNIHITASPPSTPLSLPSYYSSKYPQTSLPSP